MSKDNKKFEALNVSSKIAICGLPIRVDTYKTCGFACKYCLANCRKVMGFSKDLRVANLTSVQRRLERIFEQNKVDSTNLLDTFISQGITWHMGGMSDPFQPVEKELQITKQLIDITNKYDIHILTSTKSDTVYGADIRPDLHTFQLSVSNVYDRKDIEPNVPGIHRRYEFYRQLKADGFKVGIRIQPFIPGISDMEILDMFYDADQITIEGIKLTPQNQEQREEIISLCHLNESDFKQMGLLNLKPEIRLQLYKPFIERMEALKIPYSIADNDLHYIGTNKCCCGDRLIQKSTNFNSTAMAMTYGRDYKKEDVDRELKACGICNCRCEHLFSSNRTKGCKTVQENYDVRFNQRRSPFSPKLFFIPKSDCPSNESH